MLRARVIWVGGEAGAKREESGVDWGKCGGAIGYRYEGGGEMNTQNTVGTCEAGGIE